ncbi:MAG: DUF4363 family protein [Firmicutes bacterium]|nr:DUF4363 family protein [Bacillota bacterium]
MKRLWVGIGCLAVILAMGIFLWIAFGQLHGSLARDLRQAGTLAEAGEWERATDLTHRCRSDWERYRKWVSAFADHEPVEEMEAQFAQLEAYAAAREQAEFSALCARLATMAEAMGDSQRLTWWSLL